MAVSIAAEDMCPEPNTNPARPPKESHASQNITIVTWNCPNGPQDPYNWPSRKKWHTITLGLLANLICSMNGTILAPANEFISKDLNISNTNFPNIYWMTASWGIGAALIPLLTFPAMEDLGVRPVLLGTYLCFTCFLIPVPLAKNFYTLVIARFFSGGCVPLMSDAVASIASNVFSTDEGRSVPKALYVCVYLGSTSLGPVLGAAVLKYLDWRWIGYVELKLTAAMFPVFFFGLPESRGAAILRSRAKSMRKAGQKAHTPQELDPTPLRQAVKKSLQRPLYMLCTESVVFVAALWAAFSLGSIYLFTDSVTLVYRDLYNWTPAQSGFAQISIVIGEILGAAFSLSTNHWYTSSASRNTEVPNTPIPEARLYAAIVGGFFGVTGGMLVYAWAAYPGIHWIGITIGLCMVGFGTTAVVISIANYLVDAYAKYAASALGAVGFVENLSIAFLPLAAPALYNDLGMRWASTLLGLVSLVLVGMPFVVIRWVKEIRARSPFMKEAVIERRVSVEEV